MSANNRRNLVRTIFIFQKAKQFNYELCCTCNLIIANEEILIWNYCCVSLGLQNFITPKQQSRATCIFILMHVGGGGIEMHMYIVQCTWTCSLFGGKYFVSQ